jgi:hypothetical protein
MAGIEAAVAVSRQTFSAWTFYRMALLSLDKRGE